MRDGHHVHSGSRFLAAVLSGLLATSAMAPYAFAQPAPSTADAGKSMTAKEKRTAAGTHYNAGKTKLDAKDYAGALVEFQAANQLIPSPQAQEKIALCYDGMNDIPQAIAAYEKFIEQAKDKKKLTQDVDAARARIEALRKAPIPVKISSEPGSASVEVDGEAQMGVTPLEVKLTPGEHRIKVSAPGFEPMEKTVDVKGGEAAPDMAFALTQADAPPPPAVVPPPAAPVQQPAPVTADTGANERSNLPAYITLGVAGASAIVGTVFGIKALGDKSTFNDAPSTDKADDAERNALVADMAFGVALTLGVTGTVLLLSNKGEPEQAAAKARDQKTMRVTPFVGPTGGGAAATWRF